MRLFIFGSRKYSFKNKVFAVLESLHETNRIEAILLGLHYNTIDNMLSGADRLCAIWGRMANVPVLRFSPDFERYREHAIPEALDRMYNEGHPTHGLRFPGLRYSFIVARAFRLDDVPVIDSLTVPSPTKLTPIDRERQFREDLLSATAAAKSYPSRPHAAQRIVECIASRPRYDRFTRAFSPYLTKVRYPSRLTASEHYELWKSRHTSCPYCKAWHAPGTAHKGKTLAETRVIDRAMARFHREEMKRVNAWLRK